jgi:O-antigen ligase
VVIPTTGRIAFPEAPARAWAAVAVGGIAAVLGAAAVISPFLALTAVVGLAFTAIVFRDLAAGLALFVVLTFFERIPGFDGGGLTGVKLAGGVLAAAWLLQAARRRSEAPLLFREHPLLAFAALALGGLAFASMLWAADSGEARANAFRLAQGILLLFIVFSAIRERRHLRWVAWAYVAGAFLTAVVGLSTTSPESFDSDAARLTGGIEDPNELAALLVPALALASFGLAAVRGALVRWLLVCCVLVCAVALFMTESRGGLVALGVAFLATLALAGPLRPQAFAVLLSIAALGVGYYTLYAPPEALDRVTHFAAGGGTGRTDLWSVALEMSKDEPVLGVGAGNFPVVEPGYAVATLNLERVEFVVDTPKVTHNTYLHVLTELGAVGLALLAALVVGTLAAARRAIRALAREGDRRTEVLARGLTVGILGMLAAFVFISAQYEKQLWLLLGLAAALTTIARRRES